MQRRWKLSSAQRADMWSRWKAGQSLHEIGRALGKAHNVIHILLARHGGITPATRRRSQRVLTLAEREDISRGIASGCSMRGIAHGLNRACSTVSREIARHGGRAQYRASEADQQSWASALRPKPCLLTTHSKLQQIVASKLMQDWSPEQISGWLKQHYPNNKSLRVSHETIYRSLFVQARGALKQELVRHLRSQRRIRRSRHSSVTDILAVRSSMPFPFASVQQKSKIEPSQVIGRAICCAGRVTVTWPRWWNAIRASACW